MKALVLVDIQNDFLPGGALQCRTAMRSFRSPSGFRRNSRSWWRRRTGIRRTTDFAANHPGRKVYEQIDLSGLPQTLWPVHCVQGTPGAELAAALNQERIAKIFQKGTDPRIDSLI